MAVSAGGAVPAHLRPAAMKAPPALAVDGIGFVYARLAVLFDLNQEWAQGAPYPASASFKDVFITGLPFYIGRKPLEAEEVPKDSPNVLTVPSNKVSRLHAVIDWDEARRCFVVVSRSSNGVDVNGSHHKEGERAQLSSGTSLRVGPMYAYFLTPKREALAMQMAGSAAHGSALAAGAGGPAALTAGLAAAAAAAAMPGAAGSAAGAAAAAGGAAGGAAAPARKPTVPYRQMLSECYEKHFRQWGLFCMADMGSAVATDFADRIVSTDSEQIRKNLANAARKEMGIYETIDLKLIPPALLEEMSKTYPHSRKQTNYWCGPLPPEGSQWYSAAQKIREETARKSAEVKAAAAARAASTAATAGTYAAMENPPVESGDESGMHVEEGQ